MGKKTKLHTAAESGESEELQRLLETGLFDVDEGCDALFTYNVGGKREREREEKVGLR
jgi:hypothetical protein